MYDDNAALFDMEERDLMNDLRELPRNSAVRKINELVKRCRLAKVSTSFFYPRYERGFPFFALQGNSSVALFLLHVTMCLADGGGTFSARITCDY